LRAEYPYKDQLYILGQDEPYICYAAAANSLAVRADGSLAKCTVALYEKFNSIGRICEDGTLEVEQDRYRPWVNALLSGNPDIQACPVNTVRRQAKAI
jgi:uncharacterized protein